MAGHLAVINAGGWGTALAVLMAREQPVRLWCRRAELADEINRHHSNEVYLRGVTIPDKVVATTSLEAALIGAEAVVMVTISRAVREVAAAVAPFVAANT